jgi:endonuclease YncB( thermonuclease family)
MKKIVLLSLLMCFLCFADKENYGRAVVKRVVRIYDGDTFYVDIWNYPSIIGENIPIRIKGIDAPEIKGKDKIWGYKAALFLAEKLVKAEYIELRNMERGKYFRIVADVFVDGEDLAKIMLRKGLVKEYKR